MNSVKVTREEVERFLSVQQPIYSSDYGYSSGLGRGDGSGFGSNDGYGFGSGNSSGLALVKVLDLAMAIFLPIVLCVGALKYSTVISWII